MGCVHQAMVFYFVVYGSDADQVKLSDSEIKFKRKHFFLIFAG